MCIVVIISTDCGIFIDVGHSLKVGIVGVRPCSLRCPFRGVFMGCFV